MIEPACPLCDQDGGSLIGRTRQLRVIWADDADHPCFIRVIWNQHAREMSDLASTDQRQLLDTVLRIEALLRSHLSPDKINLASLGNMVPHLHWHIIPRWQDDAHWPGPVWAARQRDGVAHGAEHRVALAAAIEGILASLEGP